MKSADLIHKYLELLESQSHLFPKKEWYQTLLANKHRFYPNTEKLLNLINTNNITEPSFQKSLALKKSLFFLLKFGYELFLLKKKNIDKIKQSKNKLNLNIVKTFSYDHSFKGEQFQDPFLGPLAEYLINQENNVIIVHEHLGNFNQYLNQKSPDHLIHLFSFIKWSDYLGEFKKLIHNVFQNSHWQVKTAEEFIQKNFSEEKLSPQFYLHSLQYAAFKTMFEELPIKNVYSSFENNGWEKMLVLAREATSSRSKLIVHQHVPIAPSALNYYLTQQDLSVLPDKIITIGLEIKKFLQTLGYPEQKLIAGCALRLKLQSYPPPTHAQRVALIALDGIPQAAIALNSILKNSDYFKKQQWQFIVRFHPLFDESKMTPYLISPLPKQDIFEISNASLEEDIKRTNCVFYWGSTVAFEAMYSGRTVIHTPGEELLSNDPITQEGGLHFVAHDMISTINQIQSITEDEWILRKQQSKKYCEDYFGVVNAESMKVFIAD